MATSLTSSQASTQPGTRQELAAAPRLPALLIAFAAALCLVCLACTPVTYYFADVLRFANWAQATHGTTPWLAYTQPDCNYPAIPLYILTITEKLRLAAHAPRLGALELTLLKLPNILSILGGMAVCYYGLRNKLGQAYAQYAAASYGLLVALWFNGTVWGQYDPILCLGMVAAVVALVNDRPEWCGIALGLALAVKPQPIIIVPVIGVYWLARRDWKAVALGLIGAAAAWIVVSLPFFMAGAGKAYIGGYTGSFNLFQELEVNAWNGWFIVHHVGGHLLHLKNADRDDIRVLHLVTFKQIGTIIYAAYMLFLFVGLWRRPTRYNGALACAMGAFAFFMLPTDIHERYIIMTVVLMPILVPATAASRSKSAYALYVSLSVMALLEHLLFCQFEPGRFTQKITHWQHQLASHYPIGLPAALFDIGLFVWASVMYWREVYAPAQDAPDLFAPTAAASAPLPSAATT